MRNAVLTLAALCAVGLSHAAIDSRTPVCATAQCREALLGNQLDRRRVLALYPREFHGLVHRCRRGSGAASWDEVIDCTDRNIAAHRALSRYPAERQHALIQCRIRQSAHGPSAIKACVDGASNVASTAL